MIAADQSGFTLLELLVALVVLALAAALAWPSVRPNGNPTMLLRAATADLAGEFVDMRERAILDGRSRCLRLRPGHTSCTAAALRDGVSIDGPPVVRFYGDGSSSGARILLKAGGLQRELSVIGATGQIRFK